MKPVYIASVYRLNPGEDPDYRQYIPPMQARRMGRLLKRTLVCARAALAQAGVEMPDAILCGTAYGCIEPTERILASLRDNGEGSVSPTDFMQSTHNTIASTVAIQLGCHGYNCTYSQGRESFAHALLDAWLQLRAGEISSALVLQADENSASFPTEEKAMAVVLTTFAGAVSDEYPDPASLDAAIDTLPGFMVKPFMDELKKM